MNSRFLALIFFLIALLCHLVFFNVFTFVFPIDPAVPKPQFFFLGPILSQSDLKQVASKKENPIPHKILRNFSAPDNGPQKIDPTSENQAENPFAIQTIKKPILPQIAESENKIIIKSTFDAHLNEGTSKESEVQNTEPGLDIEPYRPLQFRSP
jgi:hypothetical protein